MGVLEIGGPKPEDILGMSRDWRTKPPSERMQQMVASQSDWRWNQSAGQWVSASYVPGLAGVISGEISEPVAPEEGTPISAYPTGGIRVGGTRFTRFDVEGPISQVGQTTLAGPPTTGPLAPEPPKYEPVDYEYLEAVERRMGEVGELAREDPLSYFGVYGTSAFAEGPFKAVGTGLKSAWQVPISLLGRKETMKEARERELRRVAERTIRIERDPWEVAGRAAGEIITVGGLGYGLGAAQTSLALRAPKAASYFAKALRVGGTAYLTYGVGKPLVEGEYEEALGRAGEFAVAGVYGYEMFKAGAKRQLEKEYIDYLVREGHLSAKQAAKAKSEIKIARAAGKIPRDNPTSMKSVINKMRTMKGKVGRVLYDFLKANRRDIIVGGSGAERTQLKGAMPHDIDLYVRGDPKVYRDMLYNQFKNAGISVTKGRGAGLSYGGEKIVDIHTIEHLESLIYYQGDKLTADGIRVMDVKGQFFRKVLGKYDPGQAHRYRKDVPAFESMLKQIIKTGEAKVEEAPSYFRGFEEAKVKSLKSLLSMDRKGYATYKVPKLKTPFVPIMLPDYYKPRKAPKPPKQYFAFEGFKAYVPPKKPTKYAPPYKVPKKPPVIPPYKPSFRPPRLPPYKPPRKPPKYPPSIPPPKYPPIIKPPISPPYRPPPRKRPPKPPFPELKWKPPKFRYKLPKPPKQRKGYRPSLTGIISGRKIKKPPKFYGGGVRYPVMKMPKLKPPKLKLLKRPKRRKRKKKK